MPPNAGIGLTLSPHAASGALRVTAMDPEGPAAKGGLILMGDVLYEVGETSVVGLTGEQVRSLILGPPGSPLQLGLRRQNGRIFYVRVQRAQVKGKQQQQQQQQAEQPMQRRVAPAPKPLPGPPPRQQVSPSASKGNIVGVGIGLALPQRCISVQTRRELELSVQTRRELELLVELEQAQQQIMQQEQKQKELSLELEQARQLINANAHRRQPLAPTPPGELQSAENDDGVCVVRMAIVADQQGFLEAPDATLDIKNEHNLARMSELEAEVLRLQSLVLEVTSSQVEDLAQIRVILDTAFLKNEIPDCSKTADTEKEEIQSGVDTTFKEDIRLSQVQMAQSKHQQSLQELFEGGTTCRSQINPGEPVGRSVPQPLRAPKHASNVLNELGSALRKAKKLVKELKSDLKQLTENFQSLHTTRAKQEQELQSDAHPLAKSGELQSAMNITTLAHDDAVHLVRMAIVADPEGFFERAVANSKDETISRENFAQLFAQECNASVGEISEGAKRLFDQLDRDKNDKISLTELTHITDMIRHFLKESDCDPVFSAVLMGLVQDVQSKRESSSMSSNADCAREQILKDLASLQEDVLRSALADKVAKAVAKHGAVVMKNLERLKKHGDLQEDNCDSKFGLDTATYGSVTEYHRGLDVIGAPHPNILDHMKLEATGRFWDDAPDKVGAQKGLDSTDPFEAWNSGKNKTTPEKEWDFIYDPYESVSDDKPPTEWQERHDYGGNRSPIRLQVFMHALSVTPMSQKMGASLVAKGKTCFGDYKRANEFPDTDARWLHLKEVDMVKVILLRFAKSQLDGVSLMNALDKHDDMRGKYNAEQANMMAYDIVKALDKAFHEKTKNLHSKCTLFLVKALKKEIVEKVARDLSDIDPVQARVLKHLHEVAQNLDSIDDQRHKEWLLTKIEDSKLDPDCTFDLLVNIFKDVASEEEIAKKLDKVLHDKDGPHSTCTFQYLVSKLAGIATEVELEAIMHHFHTKIAEAKLLEAEVIGLREYSGPLYVKMNGSLRVVGAHVKMVISLPCALEQCTQDFKQRFKEVIAAVAHVEAEVVSIDSVFELESRARIEFRVGVAPEKEKADEVCGSLTQRAINDGLAAKNMPNISVVEAASVVALSEHLKGNRWVNTIFSCASGMRKISQVSRIPRGRRVYRGIAGIKLPDKFVTEKEGGGRGGVDFGFTSTTTKKEVAVSYLRDKQLPVLFEIETGDIDRGCTLAFVSQYPSEDEILIPAMSYLEITSKPTLMETPKGSGFLVTVYPARINCNTKSQTIEEIQSQRKRDLLGMLSYLEKELKRDLPLVVEAIKRCQELSNETVLSKEAKEKIDLESKKVLGEFAEMRKEWEDADDKEFNDNQNYKGKIGCAIDFKHKKFLELGKLVYVNEKNDLRVDNFVAVACLKGDAELSKILHSVGFKSYPGIDINSKDAATSSWRQAAGGKKYTDSLKGRSAEAFFDSVTELVGEPPPDLEGGMAEEHLRRKDSNEWFTTHHSGVSTTPAIEYLTVVKAMGIDTGPVNKVLQTSLESGGNVLVKETRCCRQKGGQLQGDVRVLRPIQDYGDFGEEGRLKSFEECGTDTPVQKKVKKARLTRMEIVAIVLSSGPCSVLYNGMLRGFGYCGEVPEDVEFDSIVFWEHLSLVSAASRMHKAGHKYVSTMHVLASAVKKLSMIVDDGQGTRVYRALAGLDITTFKASQGFTETSFMATTRSLDVALECSGVKDGKVATLLEIELSNMDTGADISDFSQYPSQLTMLWNTCAFLQCVSSRDEIKITKWGIVTVVFVRANSNVRALTIEELEGRRKSSVVSILDAIHNDVCHHLDARAVLSDEFRSRLALDRSQGFKDAFLNSIKVESAARAKVYKDKDGSWFTSNERLGKAVTDGLSLSTLAKAKYMLWIRDTSLTLMDMGDHRDKSNYHDFARCYAKLLARQRQELKVAEETAALKHSDCDAAKRLQALALEECVARRWIAGEEDLEYADEITSFTPLWTHAFLGDLAVAVRLLQARANIEAVPSKDELRKTPLLCAAKEGNAEIALLLIKYKANLEATDRDGMTPLMYASYWGKADTARVLIEKGARLEAVDKWGRTPLDRAVDNDHEEAAAVLRTHGAHLSLLIAAKKGMMDEVATGIAAGQDVNACDSDGTTPLMYASMHGQADQGACLEMDENWCVTRKIELAKMLVAARANVSAANDRGETPLLAACDAGSLELAELLLRANANVSSANGRGDTPLLSACDKGNMDLANMLLGAGANVSAKNRRGHTPLLATFQAGNLELAKVLVANGANVDEERQDGAGLLALAIVSQKNDLLRFVLSLGCKRLDLQDKMDACDFFTLLAEAFLDPDKIKVWLKAGASPRRLQGEISALMSSVALELSTKERLEHVRAFLDFNRQILQDPLQYPVTHTLEQLVSQEPVTVFGKKTADLDKTGEPLIIVRINDPAKHTCRCTYDTQSAVLSVCLSPDGTKLALAEGQEVVMCDASTGFVRSTFKGHRAVVLGLAFSPDGTTIASSSCDDCVRVWSVASGTCLSTLRGHCGQVNCIAFSPDGSKIASTGAFPDNSVKVWDVKSAICLSTLRGHSSSVRCVTFLTDSKSFVSGSDDKTLRVWDELSDESIMALFGHSASVYSVAVSPDSTKIASASWDESVRVWDSRSGQALMTLKGHSDALNTVKFSPDGSKIASAGDDKTIILWDSNSGQQLLRLHCGHVYSITWATDGKTIISGGYDNTIRIWDIHSSKEFMSPKDQSSSSVTKVGFLDSEVFVGPSFPPSAEEKGLFQGPCFPSSAEGVFMGPSFPPPSEEKALQGPQQREVFMGPSFPSPAEEKALQGPYFASSADGVFEGPSLHPSTEGIFLDPSLPPSAEEEGVFQGPCFPSSAEVVFMGPSFPPRAEEKALQGPCFPPSSEEEEGFQGPFFPPSNTPSLEPLILPKVGSNEHILGKYLITAKGELLLIYEGEHVVAFFRAPLPISSIKCSGEEIIADCRNGDIIHLRAAWLAEEVTEF